MVPRDGSLHRVKQRVENRPYPKLWAIIMAGGTGERLWPLSRRQHPKQTLRLGTRRSLLQLAYDRLAGLVPASRTIVVTTHNQADIVRRQLPKISPEHFLIEPASRNTAAAVGLGAISILAEDPQALVVVTPADHIIRPIHTFHETIHRAASVAAARSGLVCLGIKPTFPATGYGYIEPMGKVVFPGGYRVRRFLEKPTYPVAQRLIRRPLIFWNSGIFCFKVQVILTAIRQWLPGLYAGLERILQDWALSKGAPPKEARSVKEVYQRLPSISIDVGVMERSRGVWVVPTDFFWDDVGSWNSLAFLHGTDPQGNVTLGTHVGLDTFGSVVVGQKGHLIATLGLRDAIVVQTKDATLVCHKSQAQEVRKIVAKLSASASLRYYL